MKIIQDLSRCCEILAIFKKIQNIAILSAPIHIHYTAMKKLLKLTCSWIGIGLVKPSSANAFKTLSGTKRCFQADISLSGCFVSLSSSTLTAISKSIFAFFSSVARRKWENAVYVLFHWLLGTGRGFKNFLGSWDFSSPFNVKRTLWSGLKMN